MNTEKNFGRLIFKSKTSIVRKFGRSLLFIIGLSLLIIGLLTVFAPEIAARIDEEIVAEAWMGYLITAGGVLLIGYAIFVVLRPYTARVYESGLILKRGTKIMELDYQHIGVADVFMYWGEGDSRDLYIHISEPSEKPRRLKLAKWNASHFNPFANALVEAHTNYLTKGLTKETLRDAVINFGEPLKLENCQLVAQSEGLTIPLESISSIDFSDGVLDIFGDENHKGKPERLLRIADVANVGALEYVLTLVAGD